MRTPSKKISPWLSARCPSLSSGAPRDTPGRSSGTSATPPPRRPWLGSTGQNRVATLAIVPLETQAAFWPSMIHSSPSRRATQFPRIRSSPPRVSLTTSWSLPWSGSVIAQHPISRRPATQKRSTRASRPVRCAKKRWKPDTPRLMARPASPQPSSSLTRKRLRAASTSEISSPGVTASSRSRPSAWYWSNTRHSGELGAITSSGAGILSSAAPTARSVSVAKRRAVSRTARSSSVSEISRSTSAMDVLLPGGLSRDLAAVFGARLAHHVLEDVRDLVTEHLAQPVHGLEPLQLLAPVGERRVAAQHAGVPERVDDHGVAGKGRAVVVEREARLEGEPWPLPAALRVLRRIADGLEHQHLHRIRKPERPPELPVDRAPEQARAEALLVGDQRRLRDALTAVELGEPVLPDALDGRLEEGNQRRVQVGVGLLGVHPDRAGLDELVQPLALRVDARPVERPDDHHGGETELEAADRRPDGKG